MSTACFKLIQLTDLHLLADPAASYRQVDTRRNFLAALRLSQTLQPDLLLLTGDLAEDEQLTTYQWLYQQLQASQLNWQWLPGNHDNPDLMRSLRADTFYLETSHWQILGLNSHVAQLTAGRLSAVELQGLRQALTQPKPLLLALHHHPVAVGSTWKDSIGLENAAEFWQLLAGKPQVKLVIFGHVHQEFSGYHQQVRVLATPATSIEFTPLSAEFSLGAATPALRQICLLPDANHTTQVISAVDYLNI